LAEAGKAMARSLDMDSTIGAILDALVPGLAAGALLRVDMAEGEPLQAERRRDTLVGPSAAPVLEDAMERTARLRTTELIETETAPGVRALAGLACPLVARGGVLGALGVAIRPPRPGNQLGIISLAEEPGGRAARATDNC